MKLSDSDISEKNQHQQYCWFPPAESWQIYPPVCVHIKEFNAAKKISIRIRLRMGLGDYYGDFLQPGGIELVAIDTSGHDDSWPAIEGDRSTAMLRLFDKFDFQGGIFEHFPSFRFNYS